MQTHTPQNAPDVHPRQRDGNPYALRAQLLELAFNIVRTRFQEDATNSNECTAEAVIAEASKLNDFVSGERRGRGGPVNNGTTPQK